MHQCDPSGICFFNFLARNTYGSLMRSHIAHSKDKCPVPVVQSRYFQKMGRTDNGKSPTSGLCVPPRQNRANLFHILWSFLMPAQHSCKNIPLLDHANNKTKGTACTMGSFRFLLLGKCIRMLIYATLMETCFMCPFTRVCKLLQQSKSKSSCKSTGQHLELWINLEEKSSSSQPLTIFVKNKMEKVSTFISFLQHQLINFSPNKYFLGVSQTYENEYKRGMGVGGGHCSHSGSGVLHRESKRVHATTRHVRKAPRIWNHVP